MLRRTPSLALRAGLIFVSIYLIIFLAVLALIAASSLADPGRGNHGGAVLALEYAAAELEQVDGAFRLRSDGRFQALAANNPSMWLIVQGAGRSATYGTVPGSAYQIVAQLDAVADMVQFRIPGAPMPLAVGSLERRSFGAASVLIAAGGVDPATLTVGDSLRLFLDGTILAILAFIAIISLLAMLIAIPFFSRALRPIAAEAGAICPEQPHRRLDEAKAPRELRPLVRRFNAALDRLSVELGRRKRFIADVAHELRTPLAVVLLQVESLDESQAKHDLHRALSRLTNLVKQMLELQRLSLSAPRGTFDLSTIVRDVAADLAPFATSAGYDLSVQAPEAPVLVTVDEHAIARAVTNLVTNSVNHGRGVGEIQLVVCASGRLDVIDDGPGIPESLRPHLFEPFCRGASNLDGCGLGLHLAREIARAHGGDLSLLPRAHGATFRLQIPAPPASLAPARGG